MSQCNIGCMRQIGDLLDIRQPTCDPESACDMKKCKCDAEHNIVVYNKTYLLRLKSNPDKDIRPQFHCDLPDKKDCEQFWLTSALPPFQFSMTPRVTESPPGNVVMLQFIPTESDRQNYPVYRNDVFFLQLIMKDKVYYVGTEREKTCMRLKFGKDVKCSKFSWDPAYADQLFGITHIRPKKPIDLNLQVYDDVQDKWFTVGPWRTGNNHLILTDEKGPCDNDGYFSSLMIEDVSEIQPFEMAPLLCNISEGGKLVTPPCPEGFQCVQNWCMQDPPYMLTHPHPGERRKTVKRTEWTCPSKNYSRQIYYSIIIVILLSLTIVGFYQIYRMKYKS